MILLTSGTTGAPKGAQRHQPKSLDPAAVLFDRIPLRARQNTLIAAPLFHTWGLAHFTLGMAISSTLVLRARFDPEDTLATIARERCTRADRRPGDAPADARAARGRRSPATT